MAGLIAPVSNSEISCFMRCPRQWMLRYVHGYAIPHDREPATGSMQLGSRVHAALEADKKSGDGLGPVHWLSQLYGAETLARPEYARELEAERELAEVMLTGYLEWAAETGLDEDIDILAAESDVTAEMPGMPGVTLRGRLDQMIRRRSDGAILFRDWKTTGSLEVANDLYMSPQMRFYVMLQRLRAAQDGTPPAEGGQVVYMKRSKRTVRAEPPFYAVHEARYNRDILNSTYLRTRGILTRMIQCRQQLEAGLDHREIAPSVATGTCSWDCKAFYDLCGLMDDGSDWGGMATAELITEDPYAYYARNPLPAS